MRYFFIYIFCFLFSHEALGQAQFPTYNSPSFWSTHEHVRVRAAPSFQEPIIQELLPGVMWLSGFSELKIGSNVWIEISDGGELYGYALKQSLTKHTITPWNGTYNIPVGLTCVGFEPAFLLELKPGGEIEFQRPEDIFPGSVTTSGPAARLSGELGGPLLLRHASNNNYWVEASITPAMCAGGGTLAPNSFSIGLRYGQVNGDSAFLKGCCHMR